MDIRSAFTSQYLAAYDLPDGREVTVTIEDVQIVEVEQEQGGTKPRPLVSMVGKRKGWLLNRTNSELIAAMFGYETGEWRSRRVTISRAKVRFGRETVDGIRVTGSPDIAADIKVEIKLPRKKPQAVTLRRITLGRQDTDPGRADDGGAE